MFRHAGVEQCMIVTIQGKIRVAAVSALIGGGIMELLQEKLLLR